MINYIVCDDNEIMRNNIETIINKIMMNNNIEYKIHMFSDYDKNFNKLVSQNLTNKVYILDIETPSESGINIARKIRIHDIESIIIFLTSHYELGSVLLEEEIMFLTFISKFNDMEKRLTSALNKALNHIGQKQAIRFEDHGVLYTIPVNDILYITHDSVSRKSIIKTDYTDFSISKSLSEIVLMLDGRFIRTHRACIANKSRIRMIDKKKNIISFDSGITTDLLSNMYREVELI